MNLCLEQWEEMGQFERDTMARHLLVDLPTGFSYLGLRKYQLGTRSFEVAQYQCNGAIYSLIPSVEATLGYQQDRPWSPDIKTLESWNRTAEILDVTSSLDTYLRQILSPHRKVKIRTLLIEVLPNELGWIDLSIDDVDVKEIIRKNPKSKIITLYNGDSITRVRKFEKNVMAERGVKYTHEELSSQMRVQGFRFPTSDEWEYACGGGAATLFRWGDHCPIDRYPSDLSPEEAAWRRDWAVYAQISELDSGDECWPFTDTLLVVGTISVEELSSAVSSLQPDVVDEIEPCEIPLAIAKKHDSPVLAVWWD